MWARVFSLLCILCFKFSYALWSYCLIESSESWENRNAALLNKTSFIPNEGQEFITHLPALTTGLNIPGSDSWTWMNQSGSHWTVSGVPHSNHSYPQLGLNRTIQHFKKRKQWGTGCDFVDKEIIRVAPGAFSPFLTPSWGHLPGSEISLKMNMAADFCDISDPSWIME